MIQIYPEKYAEVYTQSKLLKVNVFKPVAGNARFYFDPDEDVDRSVIHSIIFQPSRDVVGPALNGAAIIGTGDGALLNLTIVTKKGKQMIISRYPIRALAVNTPGVSPLQRLANRFYNIRDHSIKDSYITFNTPTTILNTNPIFCCLTFIFKPL